MSFIFRKLMGENSPEVSVHTSICSIISHCENLISLNIFIIRKVIMVKKISISIHPTLHLWLYDFWIHFCRERYRCSCSGAWNEGTQGTGGTFLLVLTMTLYGGPVTLIDIETGKFYKPFIYVKDWITRSVKWLGTMAASKLCIWPISLSCR